MTRRSPFTLPRSARPWLRAVAWLVLAAFTGACTHEVARPPLETRRFAVDWEQLDARRIAVAGLVMDGVVLTPAQWPLEASMKKLLQADFVGVVDTFDLRFRSATLRGDVLERLFDAGFLPVYLKVRNPGEKEAPFDPGMVVVRADGTTTFYPYAPEELPGRFREIDWAATGGVVIVAALMVLLVLAGREGRGASPGMIRGMDMGVRVGVESHGRGGYGSSPGSGSGRPTAQGPRQEPGLLAPMVLAPGEEREGFLFFRLERTVADWGTARIEAP